MKRLVVLSYVFLFVSCGSVPKIEGNQSTLSASKNGLELATDPYRFVEDWGVKKEKRVWIERILFDGKVYEALVSVGEKGREKWIAMRFKEDDHGYIFLDQRPVKFDYAWPTR